MPDVVYDAVLGSNPLKQITNSSFDEQLQVLTGRMSGGTYGSDHFVEGAGPKMDLTSVDIGGFITAFGAIGSRIADGSTVIVPWAKRASGSTFAGTGANVQVAGVDDSPVQLIPRSINAPRSGTPTAQGEVWFLSADGKLAPHAITLNEDLASQAFGAMYGLGPVAVNGSFLPKQIGFNINFGVGLSEPQRYDGLVWPTDCFIETVDPTIEVSVEDFDIIASFTGGAAITSVKAYLRKRTTGSTFVADGTAQHCKFSFTGGIITPKQLSAQETKHGQAGIMLTGRQMTVSAASAITT